MRPNKNVIIPVVIPPNQLVIKTAPKRKRNGLVAPRYDFVPKKRKAATKQTRKMSPYLKYGDCGRVSETAFSRWSENEDRNLWCMFLQKCKILDYYTLLEIMLSTNLNLQMFLFFWYVFLPIFDVIDELKVKNS